MKIGTDRIVISIEVEMAPPPKKMAWNQWVPRGVSNPKKLRLFHWWWSHTCCRRWGEGGLQKAQVAIASKWVHQTPKLAYPQSHTQCGGKVLAKVSKIEAQWILSPMYCHCCWWYVLTTAWCGIPPRFVVVLAAWFVVVFVVRGNGSFLLAHLFIFLVEMPAWFLEKNKSRDFFGGSKIKIISAFVSKKKPHPRGSTGMTSARALCGRNRRQSHCGSAHRRKHCLWWIFWRIKGPRRSFVSWERLDDDDRWLGT